MLAGLTEKGRLRGGVASHRGDEVSKRSTRCSERKAPMTIYYIRFWKGLSRAGCGSRGRVALDQTKLNLSTTAQSLIPIIRNAC